MFNKKKKGANIVLTTIVFFLIWFLIGTTIIITHEYNKLEEVIEIYNANTNNEVKHLFKGEIEAAIKRDLKHLNIKTFFVYFIGTIFFLFVFIKILNVKIFKKMKNIESELTGLNQGVNIERPKFININYIEDSMKQILNSIYEYKDKINYYSKYDNLTGLMNRNTFIEEVDSEIEKAVEKNLCLIYMNLDGFSYYNNNFGYHKGDEILKDVAEVISSKVVGRNSLISRIGGDEFAIFLTDQEAIENICTYVENLILSVNSIQNNTNAGFVSVSLGICMKNKNDKSAAAMMNNAYLAMNIIKEREKNSYEFFSSNNKKEITLDMIEKAMENGNIQLHYQPKVNLKTNQIDGVEALVRWFDDELGYISPGAFIKVAEDTGYIITLGEWILNKAIKDIHALNKELKTNISVAVNVSPIQFLQKAFVGKVTNALESVGMDAKNLELEMTEGIGLFNSKDVVQKFEDISNLGVSIAIDDFGTGYSSVAYLKEFKIDTIKIDRSFVIQGEKNRNIVRYIIDVSKNLGFKVVAEGVEDYMQARMLKELECDYIQGYFFYKPMPIVRLRESIKR